MSLPRPVRRESNSILLVIEEIHLISRLDRGVSSRDVSFLRCAVHGIHNVECLVLCTYVLYQQAQSIIHTYVSHEETKETFMQLSFKAFNLTSLAALVLHYTVHERGRRNFRTL